VVGLKILVGIIAASHLTDALKHAPDWRNSGTDSTHNAIFAIPPATAEGIFSSVGEAKPIALLIRFKTRPYALRIAKALIVRE
jgi:hypothetical protein